MLKINQRLICFTLLCFAISALHSAYAGNQHSFKTDCGNVKFRVEVLNKGYAFDNSYRLFADTASGAVELYSGQDWFFAACLAASSGKPLLVFQNYCSGSACNEKNYGAVEPSNLAMLLQPNADQAENSQAMNAILGFAAPNLAESEAAFCCAGQAEAPPQAVASNSKPVTEVAKPVQANPIVETIKPVLTKPVAVPAKPSPAQPQAALSMPTGLTNLGLTMMLIFAALVLVGFFLIKRKK